MAYPDFSKPFILCTDGSFVGLGAVLEQCQLDDQRPQSIQFASASLSPAQKNYAITELECLAVVWGIQKFKHYRTCMNFKLVTDHSALNYVLQDRGNQLTGRLARWKILLQGMAYEVDYRKGTDNKVPDALSRAPVPPEIEPPYDELVEQFAFVVGVELDLANPMDRKRAQGEDLFCAEIIGYLAAKRKKRAVLSAELGDIIRRTAHDYVVNNGVLHRSVITTNGRLSHKSKAVRPVVVPASLQPLLLVEVHDSPMGGGHLGRRATYTKLQARFYWPTMARDLTEYLKRCKVCAQFY